MRRTCSCRKHGHEQAGELHDDAPFFADAGLTLHAGRANRDALESGAASDRTLRGYLRAHFVPLSRSRAWRSGAPARVQPGISRPRAGAPTLPRRGAARDVESALLVPGEQRCRADSRRRWAAGSAGRRRRLNRSQLDRILKLVDQTVARGARAVLRGEPQGLVLPPIVLADVTNDMPAAREEIFGPVAPILRFQDEEEAIRIANDTEYGLSSAVFTRDVERGVRVAKRIQAGMTHVNDWPVDDEPNTAFGGEKASGLGRFAGAWAHEEFTTDHWISVQEKPRRYPIWLDALG